MESSTLPELKKELLQLPSQKVLELCMRLAKHKKENKELLSYLLFDAGNETDFISRIKGVMDEQFETMNSGSLYLAKKTLRKVLRTANKYIRFSGSDKVGVELLIYFCSRLKQSGLPLKDNTVIGNLYHQQRKKIQSFLSKMHEDLQYDYASMTNY